MSNRRRRVFSGARREFSRNTLLLGAAFTVMLIAMFGFDFDAALRYFNVVGGWPRQTASETAAIISLACIIPFIAMGMSISEDMRRKRHE